MIPQRNLSLLSDRLVSEKADSPDLSEILVVRSSGRRCWSRWLCAQGGHADAVFHLFQLESRGGCNTLRAQALFTCFSFRSPPPLPKHFPSFQHFTETGKLGVQPCTERRLGLRGFPPCLPPNSKWPRLLGSSKFPGCRYWSSRTCYMNPMSGTFGGLGKYCGAIGKGPICRQITLSHR